MSNNKRIIILLIFVISLLSFSSFFTISRYAYKKTLTGNINSKVIKIEFEPNGNDTYQVSQSTVVNVIHKSGRNFRILKYVWSTTEVDASTGTDFTSGDEITKSTDEGEYYLCIYAEDIMGLRSNVCSNTFKIDAKGPSMTLSHEYENGNYYIVVEVSDNGTGINDVISNESSTFDHVNGNKYYFNVNSGSNLIFTASDNLNNTTTKSYDLCHEIEGTVTNFPYTGGVQSFSPVCSGLYQIEAWGAEGGTDTYDANAVGQGKGAYTRGNIGLTSGDTLYVYVGERGIAKEYSQLTLQHTFNGGGYANVRPTDTAGGHLASGGGASDIRITGGTWDNANSLRSRIMVAAGGAGGFYAGSEPGAGGGLKGYDGVKSTTNWWSTLNAGFGANQTEPGALSGENYLIIGGFGYGGTSSGGSWGGGAGGSGWYGGSGGYVQSGGGGSSYISGHTGCVGVASTSSSSPKSGCTTGTTNRSCSLSPYEKEFTNTIMIDGKGCKWTNAITSECSGQPQPDGTTSLGHSGNGYVRIKFLSKQYTLSYDYEGCTSKNIYNGQKYGTLCSPTAPAGYNFEGWYLGNTKINSDTIVNVESDVELTARFVEKDITLTFNTNGKKNYFVQNGLIKTNFTNKANDVLYVGGFDTNYFNVNDKLKFNIIAQYNGLTASSGSDYSMIFQTYGKQTGWQNGTGFNFPSSFKANNSGTRTELFEKNYNTITSYQNNTGFNIQLRTDYYTAGGIVINNAILTKVTEQLVTKKYGSTIGTLPTTTDGDYKFDGWYTAPTGGIKISASTKVPTVDTTYYAHWIAKPMVDFRIETINNVKYIAVDVHSPDIAISSVTSSNGLTQTNMKKNLKIYLSAINENKAANYKASLEAAGFTNITTAVSTYPTATELKNGGYNLVILAREYASVPADVNAYFTNGLNVITTGNDTTNTVNIAATATYSGADAIGLVYKTSENNIARKIGASAWIESDTRNSITCRNDSEVLFKERIVNTTRDYDVACYYNSNGVKWFHLQNNNYNVNFITAAAEYISANNVYYFRVNNTGTYTFVVKDTNNNNYTYTYSYN